MPFGAPNIVPDMHKTGDDAMWQQVEYYMANKDDHTMMFHRAAFNRIVTFLYAKAKENNSCQASSTPTGSMYQRLKQIFGTPSAKPDSNL